MHSVTTRSSSSGDVIGVSASVYSSVMVAALRVLRGGAY